MQNDGTTVTTYTYSPANRLTLANANGALTTYTNDAAGNRTQMQAGSTSVYYSWDAANRMVSAEPVAGTVTFTYNADGQRVAKQSTDGSITGFLYDHKHLLQETDGVGGTIENTYVTTTTEEYGDLLSEDGGSVVHQYDAQATPTPCSIRSAMSRRSSSTTPSGSWPPAASRARHGTR